MSGDVDGKINWISNVGDEYDRGDEVGTTVNVENTGDAVHTFFVGYDVVGPDGENYNNNETTGTQLELASGDRTNVRLYWDVEDDVPTGTYDIITALWAESDKDNLHTRLDQEEDGSAFEVIDTEQFELRAGSDGNGSIGINPPGMNTRGTTREYDEGSSVELSVTSADSDYSFDGWDGDIGSASATDETITVTMDRDRLIAATFEREAIDAAVNAINPDRGEYKPGDTVETRANVENTGNTTHTFFVGYSVFDESGIEYTNNDRTGRTIRLDPNDSTTIDLEWVVEDGTPEGNYDVLVAIWEESDRDNLRNRLGDERENRAFAVTLGEQFELRAGSDGNGAIGIDPPGMNTRGTTREYDEGTNVELSVTSADSDYSFDEWNGDIGSTSATDETITVTMDRDRLITATFREESEEIDGEINWISSDGGPHRHGEQVVASVNVKNTGDSSHTFFAGYSVHGPNGDTYDNDDGTGQTVSLSPDESQSIDLGWVVESDAPDGSYDIQVALWEESDRDNLWTRLDEEWGDNVFEVETQEGITGQINSISPDDGTFNEGESVQTSASIENTGNVDHSFFVGYTVHGPEGTEYDNDGGTGQEVWLQSGESATVELNWDVEPDAPNGEYDVQAALWEENNRDELQTRLDEEREDGAFTVETEETEVDGQINSINPNSDSYTEEDTVVTTVEVENTGHGSHTFFVGYSVHGPNDEIYDNEDGTGQTVTLDPDESTSIDLSWDIESDASGGEYNVQVAIWEESDHENLHTRVDEEWENNAFEVVRDDTDYAVAARDFGGDPVSDAVVRLSSPNSTRILEERLNSTSVTFEGLTENRYSFEIESAERNQSLSGTIYTDNPVKQYTAHFPPAGHPHGVVLDDENGFAVPYADVEIPELGIQTRSNKAGYFDIDENVPRGEYEIRVAVPDGGTVETSAEFGPEYGVTLEANSEPVNDESVDEDRRDFIESDVLTNILLETEALRERIRNGGRAIATAIHGAVRGVAAALYDIYESVREVLSAIIENIGIPDFGSLLSDLIDIATNLPTAIAAMGQSLIAGVENFVESAAERQHDANPHSDYLKNTPTPSSSDPEYTWYRSFSGGWNFGYFGFKLAELVAVVGAIRRAGMSIITSGPQSVRDALDAIESTATSIASGTSRSMVSPVGRSGRATSRGNSGDDTFDNVLASGLGVARVASANIIKQVRTGIGEIRHKPNNAIREELEDVIQNIGAAGRDAGEMKGKLNEWASIGHWVNNENAFRALPSIRSGHVVGRFDITDYNHGDWVLVPKVDPSFDGELDGVLFQVIKNNGDATITNVRIIEFKKGTDTNDGKRIDPPEERTQKFSTVEEIQDLPGETEIAGTGLRARHFDNVEKKDVYLIGNRKHTTLIRDNPERTPTTANRRWDGYADYASTDIDEYYDALVGLDAQQRRIEFSTGGE